MVNKVSMWAQGIIIAIIIGTVIQMIIPESKNKKYIQTIIGIYILFCIINPVIGNTINLDDYNLNQYMSINETTNNKENQDLNVKKVFESKIKTSIKQELNNNGYDSDSIETNSDNNYNISFIRISNVKEYKSENQLVNRVHISIKEKPATGMPNSDKEKIKKSISQKYNISENLIEIK